MPAKALNACGLDVRFATRYADNHEVQWQEGLQIVDRHTNRAVLELWFANGVQQPYSDSDNQILSHLLGSELEAVTSLASGVAALYQAGTPEGAEPSSSLLEQSPLTAVFKMQGVVDQAQWYDLGAAPFRGL